MVYSQGISQPRRTIGRIKPQLFFFLPPVYHWFFPLGEPTQKPEAWSPNQSTEMSLQVPKQDGEWIWKGRQETFLTLMVKSCGIPGPTLHRMQFKDLLLPGCSSSAPTPKTSQSIPTATALSGRGVLGCPAFHLCLSRGALAPLRNWYPGPHPRCPSLHPALLPLVLKGPGCQFSPA